MSVKIKITSIIKVFNVIIFLLVICSAFVLSRLYKEALPQSVVVSNLGETAASVSWISSYSTTGEVLLDNNLVNVLRDKVVEYFDDRDTRKSDLGEASQIYSQILDGVSTDISKMYDKADKVDKGSYYIHHVTLTGLQPDTEYTLTLKNGDYFRRRVKIKTMTSNDTLSTPTPAYGFISMWGGTSVPVNTVVYIELADELSGLKTLPLSTTLASNGSWYFDLSNVKMDDGSSFFAKTNQLEAVSVKAKLTIQSGSLGVWSKYLDIESIAPAESIVIGEPDTNMRYEGNSLVYNQSGLFGNVYATECSGDSKKNCAECLGSSSFPDCENGYSYGANGEVYGPGYMEWCARAYCPQDPVGCECACLDGNWDCTSGKTCQDHKCIAPTSVPTQEPSPSNAAEEWCKTNATVTKNGKDYTAGPNESCEGHYGGKKCKYSEGYPTNDGYVCQDGSWVKQGTSATPTTTAPTGTCGYGTYSNSVCNNSVCTSSGVCVDSSLVSAANVKCKQVSGNSINIVDCCKAGDLIYNGNECVSESECKSRGGVKDYSRCKIESTAMCDYGEKASGTVCTNSDCPQDLICIAANMRNASVSKCKSVGGTVAIYDCCSTGEYFYDNNLNACISNTDCVNQGGHRENDICVRSSSGGNDSGSLEPFGACNENVAKGSANKTTKSGITYVCTCSSGAGVATTCAWTQQVPVVVNTPKGNTCDDENCYCDIIGYSISHGQYCPEVANCSSSNTYGGNNGKICDKEGHTCQYNSTTGIYECSQENNGSSLNDLLEIQRVYAAEDTEKISYSAETGQYLFEENGVYTLEKDGKKYSFDVQNTEQEVIIFFDKNANKVYDKEVDELIQYNPQSITITKVLSKYTYDLETGFNFVAFNFIPEDYEYASASALLTQLNKITNNKIYSIATYDSKWKIVGENGGQYNSDDFVISPGKGYLVKAKSDVTFTLNGKEIIFETEGDEAPVYLNTGWNLVSVYGSGAKKYTAETLLDDINVYKSVKFEAVNISRWDASKQMYEGLQKIADDNNVMQVYGFDFDISDAQGYFVRLNKGSGLWNPTLGGK